MAKALPASVDTITTRFLILFLFLLSIPLAAIISFTVSSITYQIEQQTVQQLNLSQALFNQKVEQTEARLIQLRNAMDNQRLQGQTSCLNTPGLLCLALDSKRATVQRVPNQDNPGLATPKLTPSSSLTRRLASQVLSQEAFWLPVHQTLYLVCSSKVSGETTHYFYALPLTEALVNGIFKSIPDLDTGIWIHLNEPAQGQWVLQGGHLKQSPALQQALTQDASSASQLGERKIALNLHERSFRIQWQILYTPENRPLAQVAHILPLEPYQNRLKNFYIAIYCIAVASLLFSVLLAMLAGRTITQPLLKLIRQVKALNQESVMKESDQVSVGGVLEIQQLSTAFNHMILRLRQEHKIKDNFVATLTHDLKVPLLAESQTLSYFLKQVYGPLNNEQVEVLGILKSSNQSCLSLVNGLLQVYRYESGEVSLMYERFNLQELMESTLQELNAMAQEKSIQLELLCQVKDTKNTLVYADPMEIKRVLHNLISNAITNTPIHGNIECKIVDASSYGSNTIYKVSSFQYTSLKHPVKLEDKLLVVVQDSGIGFSNDDLPQLFKQFSAGKGRNPMSIGLGLFNCFQVLRAHYNPLWVESTEGQGSAVSFLLSVKPPRSQDRRMAGDRRQRS